MKRPILPALLAAAALAAGFLTPSCETYDPNDPNDPFNRRLDAQYGPGTAPYGQAPPPGYSPVQGQPPRGYNAPPQTQTQAPTPPPRPAPAPVADVGRLLQLVNAERSRNGLGQLSPDARLTRAAINHSNYLARTRVLSHAGPSGERAGARMMSQGYVWRAFAENIAHADTAEKTMTQWMNSPPHRANLLGSAYNDVGIGHAGGYWTIVFGRHR